MACQCEKGSKDYNILNVAIDVATKKAKFVGPDVQEERLAVCRNCPTNDLKILPGVKAPICGVCKCLVETKVKFAQSQCPKRHWLKVEN